MAVAVAHLRGRPTHDWERALHDALKDGAFGAPTDEHTKITLILGTFEVVFGGTNLDKDNDTTLTSGCAITSVTIRQNGLDIVSWSGLSLNETIVNAWITAVDSYAGSSPLDTYLSATFRTDVIYTLVDSAGPDAAMTANGSTSDDSIFGSKLADMLNGSDGGDWLQGRNGNDEINGGNGNDWIDGGTGDDTIDAGAGEFDLVKGSPGADSIDGNSGFDAMAFDKDFEFYWRHVSDGLIVTLNGGPLGSPGSGSIAGAYGADENGTPGASVSSTFESLERISGTWMDDAFVAIDTGFKNTTEANGFFAFVGGEGTDTFTISQRGVIIDYDAEKWCHQYFDGAWDGISNNVLVSEKGVKVNLTDSSKNDVAAARALDTFGNSDILAISGRASFRLTDLVDKIWAGDSGAYAEGRDGGDEFFGGKGADEFKGGAGNDVMSGDAGSDKLFGEDDEDSLHGGQGDDWVFGGDGNDTLEGGEDADRLFGGLGNDVYVFRRANNDLSLDRILDIGGIDCIESEVSVDLNSGLRSLRSSGVENVKLLGAGNLNATGNDSKNVLEGNNGINVLTGRGGNDTLYGGLGNDTLNGGANNDVLIGGQGRDFMTGGANADIFRFSAGDSGPSRATIDIIKDYQKGSLNSGDKIDFTGGALTIGGSNEVANMNEASINMTNGKAVFAAGTGLTLTDALLSISARLTAAGDAAGEFAFFRVANAGTWHLFISDGVAGVGANDVVVQLSNLTGAAGINTINLLGGDLTILT